MNSKKEVQHVYLVGAKSLGAYGGYETFVYKLTEYHQNKENIKYHVACKANGDGCMDESKFDGVTKINDHEFEFHNAHCFKIDVPQIGPAQAIYYDVAALKACCEHIKKNHIPHGAVISVQGDGYLFTAPSGTGKSTHVSLWKKYIDGVEIINGDKPFLRVTDHGIWAYGTPWAGKEGWQKNEGVLLKGICLLMRGKENRVSMLVQEQVLAFLIRQIYYTDNPEMAGKTLELLDQVMKQIYFYEVSCNVSKEAALCCYDGLRGV